MELDAHIGDRTDNVIDPVTSAANTAHDSFVDLWLHDAMAAAFPVMAATASTDAATLGGLSLLGEPEDGPAPLVMAGVGASIGAGLGLAGALGASYGEAQLEHERGEPPHTESLQLPHQEPYDQNPLLINQKALGRQT